ncbi:ribosome assembly cofactor RimP [Micrococcus sp.]|uniref:ribosome maturation factor RimP n=1 Tax=Micrococcus sp. TaxID=1271 RepID=UPI002A9169D4|nr:ribosome assembly cofactor RimP [Micrococcus sp.]MDY6055317.1 ribosome assembly cofactor RimP [Micrococcus sp.]
MLENTPGTPGSDAPRGAAPSALHDLVASALRGREDIVLEGVRLTGAASTPTLEVVLDRASGTQGLSLDEMAELTGLVSAALDAAGDDVPGVGAGEYLLEVGTAGVDRPLTEARHFARNVGRLVEVSVDGASPVTARLLAAGEDAVELAVVRPGAKKGMPARQLPAESVALDRLGPATVQVEWSSAPGPDGARADQHTARHTEA